MSTRDDIEAFLLADIPTVITGINLDAGDVYLGQERRNNQGDYEALIRYVRFEELQRDQAAKRHHVEIEIQGRRFEDQREDEQARLVFEAAEEIQETYDADLDRFATGMPDVLVERVRAGIPDRVSIEFDGYERRAMVSLQIDEWE